MSFDIKLQPKYDSRKSFYGKAKVVDEDGKKVLYSFNTKVAEIKDGKARVFGTYSGTTTRHVKEFLLQNGFEVKDSKQIMADYGKDTSEETFKVEQPKNVEGTITDYGDGKAFWVNDSTKIIATAEKTRNGFKHTARLIVNGEEVDKSTAHYLNRTWESYEYESVVDNLISKTTYIKDEDKDKLKKKFQETSHGKIQSEFKTIGAIASLGELFGQTKKEKNDWKLRMIKAGLGNRGLEVPEDWDKLSEDEKEKRLDMVTKHLKER